MFMVRLSGCLVCDVGHAYHYYFLVLVLYVGHEWSLSHGTVFCARYGCTDFTRRFHDEILRRVPGARLSSI